MIIEINRLGLSDWMKRNRTQDTHVHTRNQANITPGPRYYRQTSCPSCPDVSHHAASFYEPSEESSSGDWSLVRAACY